jgi:hypothetical protein
MFWGLRECRTINLQAIQQAEVSIDCAGARITKTIKNVQRNPNFESSATDADKYKLRVVCINRYFQRKFFLIVDILGFTKR